jgi:SSS family solute:Na+ symporter
MGVNVIVSLLTAPKSLAELEGLVYGATKIPAEDPVPLYKNEWFWTAISVVAFVAVNVYFW